jgi:hypothetical protein
MDSKQVQQIEETAQQVHNTLANALVSLHIVRANFDAFSPARRVTFEVEWERAHQQAIEDLRTSLALFGAKSKPTSTRTQD